MEKETIGLKAIIMFDMLQVVFTQHGDGENDGNLLKTANCHTISSPHIFHRRILRHVRSRYVTFHYTPATKYNRVDMYCVTSQLGWEPHTGRTVFSPLS